MIAKNLAVRVKKALGSENFFKWIIAVFLVQAVFSMFVISSSTPIDGIGGRYTERNENGVVPDGHRHIGAIYYYAERPITAGPVITNMPEGDLWMGDLERFPSYFYYYALSFPVRVAMALNFSDIGIVWLIRLIGIGLGVLSLLVFRRIVALVSKNVIVQNLSVLALALTGSFVWLSAGENYDVSALLLWMAFVYSALALFTKNHAKYLYWMALWFGLLGVTKYTYIPFAGIGGLAALLLYWRNNQSDSAKLTLIRVKSELGDWIKRSRTWLVVAGAAALVVSGGLFTERIVVNLIKYQSFNPSCTSLHSHEGCMNFGVYARNYNQKQAMSAGEADKISYTPYGYLGLWAKRYYDSMYAYMGHIYIPRYSALIEISGVLALITGVCLYVLAKRKKIRILRTQQEWYILGLTLALVVAQFLFNVKVILKYDGQLYAHQGRYLLSAVGFIYLLYFILLQRSKFTNKYLQKWFILGGLVVAAYVILTTSAIPSFLIHAINPEWYSELARYVLPGWIINHPIIW